MHEQVTIKVLYLPLLPDICKNTDWFDGSQRSPACPYEQHKYKYESGVLVE
jgi:hypothetical protein